MRDEGLVSGDGPFANLLTQGMVLSGTYYRQNADGSKTYYFADDVELQFNDKGQPQTAPSQSRWATCHYRQNRENVKIQK